MVNTLKKNYLIYGILIIAVVGILGFTVVKNGSNAEETLIVKKENFLQQVSISGKVISSESVDLAFSQTGRVSNVYVDVGDEVAKGTILASIENGDVRAEILQKKATLLATEAVLNELKRGLRPEKITISKAKVHSAEINLAKEQRSLREKISDVYIKSDDAVRTQADQFISNPNSLNPRLVFNTDGQIEQDILSLRVKLEGVLTSWNLEISTQNDINKLAGTSLTYSSIVKTFLEKVTLAFSTLDSSSTLSQATINGWKSDISNARTTLSTATSNLVSVIGNVDSAKAALSLSQKELLLDEAGVTKEDIEEQEAKVKAAEADVVSIQAKYQKTLVTAPFTGIVSKMDAKVGGSASSNTSLVSMISIGALQVESFVPEINSPLIKVGDSATVTLDAYGKDVVFNTIIISIDPAETIRDGVSTYKTKLQFNEYDSRVKPGMTANIVVTTEEKKDVIAIPQGIVFSEGNKKFVYIKDKDRFVRRAVIVGSVSSLGEVEILSGLNEGDIVSFNQPK